LTAQNVVKKLIAKEDMERKLQPFSNLVSHEDDLEAKFELSEVKEEEGGDLLKKDLEAAKEAEAKVIHSQYLARKRAQRMAQLSGVKGHNTMS